MKLTTAGESHGKGLIAVIEGLPAHLKINTESIDSELALRQRGYGRGGRQRIERDHAEILSGVRDGETLGSPLTLFIQNLDYENAKSYMSPEKCDAEQKALHALTKVRPGHADLAGAEKFQTQDARDVLERASARESAARVAAGAVFKAYLSALGVEIKAYVSSVFGIDDGGRYAFSELSKAQNSPLGMLDPIKEKAATDKIDELKNSGDTAGGIVEIRVRGLKSGFGSPMTYAEKLDSRLAAALMSIQAAKGVEFGDGFDVARRTGETAHDQIIIKDGKPVRLTNRAGGIEGGMSNGEEIVVRVAMKPIPTLKKGLQTVDISTGKAARSASERSDVCAIFAFMKIAESAVAEVIAGAVSRRLGGDTMGQVIQRYQAL